MVWLAGPGQSRHRYFRRALGAVHSGPRVIRIFAAEGKMTDLIVFGVGLIVSTLVVFGIFSRVVVEMHDAKDDDAVRTEQPN